MVSCLNSVSVVRNALNFTNRRIAPYEIKGKGPWKQTSLTNFAGGYSEHINKLLFIMPEPPCLGWKM